MSSCLLINQSINFDQEEYHITITSSSEKSIKMGNHLISNVVHIWFISSFIVSWTAREASVHQERKDLVET